MVFDDIFANCTYINIFVKLDYFVCYLSHSCKILMKIAIFLYKVIYINRMIIKLYINYVFTLFFN